MLKFLTQHDHRRRQPTLHRLTAWQLPLTFHAQGWRLVHNECLSALLAADLDRNDLVRKLARHLGRAETLLRAFREAVRDHPEGNTVRSEAAARSLEDRRMNTEGEVLEIYHNINSICAQKVRIDSGLFNALYSSSYRSGLRCLRVRRRSDPGRWSVELDRPNDNLLSVTFTVAPSDFEEASRVVKIIAGEIEPQ